MLHRPHVVILGGGIAGLWLLHELCGAGYDAFLFESARLGAGQSIQAQGIIHGGGKYALRRVGDRAAIEAIRDMPSRWLEHHRRGDREGRLAEAETEYLQALFVYLCALFVDRQGGRLGQPADIEVQVNVGIMLGVEGHFSLSLFWDFAPAGCLRKRA